MQICVTIILTTNNFITFGPEKVKFCISVYKQKCSQFVMFSYAQNNVMITFITILIVLDEYVGI